MQVPYWENDKIVLKDIKEGQNKWRGISCIQTGKCQFAINWPIDSMQSQSNPHKILS